MAKKDVINIGIIGAGFARRTQIPGFRACKGARVVAIASRTRANAERVAREFDIPAVADDWREVIARDDVDLVSIVTPPATHIEMTLAALDAGKAVLCEKPTAMNAAEAETMMRRARGLNAFAHLDHELRFLDGRRRMRAMIHEGEIGAVRHVNFVFRADSRADASRAWDWWSDARMGGGALGAIGSHAVDSFRWLLGAEVSAVSARLATHIRERVDRESGETRAVTTDDEANLLVDFADTERTGGATGTISLSVVEPGRPEHLLEIFGSRGALRVEDRGALWHAPVGAGEWRRIETEPGDIAPGMRDSGWARGFTRFAREIVEALKEGRTSVAEAATFEDGYRTQLVLDAARRAHEENRRVAIQ